MKIKDFLSPRKLRIQNQGENLHLKINAQGDFAYYPLRRIQNPEDFA